MKCNYKEKHKSEFEKLPKIEQQEISKFIFKSAIKTVIAVVLFRCEKVGWHKDRLERLFWDIVGIFQIDVMGKHISDIDLIEKYEKMLGVDFDVFDNIGVE